MRALIVGQGSLRQGVKLTGDAVLRGYLALQFEGDRHE